MGLMGLMLYWLSCRTAMLRKLRRGVAAGWRVRSALAAGG